MTNEEREELETQPFFNNGNLGLQESPCDDHISVQDGSQALAGLDVTLNLLVALLDLIILNACKGGQ